MSSLIISPGWTGGIPFLFFIFFALVVIFKINIHGIFAGPRKSNAVVSCHPHGPAHGLALKAVEAKPGDIHITRLGGDLQQLKNAHVLSDEIGSYPACLAGAVEFL